MEDVEVAAERAVLVDDGARRAVLDGTGSSRSSLSMRSSAIAKLMLKSTWNILEDLFHLQVLEDDILPRNTRDVFTRIKMILAKSMKLLEVNFHGIPRLHASRIKSHGRKCLSVMSFNSKTAVKKLVKFVGVVSFGSMKNGWINVVRDGRKCVRAIVLPNRKIRRINWWLRNERLTVLEAVFVLKVCV